MKRNATFLPSTPVLIYGRHTILFVVVVVADVVDDAGRAEVVVVVVADVVDDAGDAVVVAVVC